MKSMMFGDIVTTINKRLRQIRKISAATVILILIAAEPMLEKLDRIKVKYGLMD